MQTLLTESLAKFESKFRDAHFSQSFHDFIGASNHNSQELLKMNEGDRRYVIINTTKLPYTTDDWANLWCLVKDSAERELFWQFIKARDVSSVQPGKAPSNQTKAVAIAEQAPDAVQYAKYFCLVASNDMQPRDTLALVGSNSNQLPLAVQQHPECFTIKERSSEIAASPAFQNLLGEQLEQALLHYDFVQGNRVCTNVLEKQHVSLHRPQYPGATLHHSEREGVQA